MMSLYLDNSATTPVTKPVLNAMLPYFSSMYGNPSSSYKYGRIAKAAIKQAREQFAKAINAKPEQIFFTSGATESNNLVRRFFGENDFVATSIYEHPSMLSPVSLRLKNLELNQLGVTGWFQHIKQFKEIDSKVLLSWQYVNSETGMIFPIKEITEIAHMNNAYFHSDMTAAFGKVPIDVEHLDVDFASFSGHKFHAPKGIGVLYIKEPKKFHSDIIGGGQESNLRSGTENVPAIVGIGKAAELYNYSEEKEKACKIIRDKLITQLCAKMPCDFKILENKNFNVPSILNIAIQGVEGESVALILDSKEIFVSTGSACHSKSLEASQTVKSFNLPKDYEHGTIRISFDETFRDEDVNYFVNTLVRTCEILMGMKN